MSMHSIVSSVVLNWMLDNIVVGLGGGGGWGNSALSYTAPKLYVTR